MDSKKAHQYSYL